MRTEDAGSRPQREFLGIAGAQRLPDPAQGLLGLRHDGLAAVNLFGGQELGGQHQVGHWTRVLRQVPEPGGPAFGPGGQAPVLVEPLHASQFGRVAQWRRQWFAVGGVPKPDRVVVGDRRNPAVVFTEGPVQDLVLVAQRRRQLSAGGGVPQYGRKVLAAGEDLAALVVKRGKTNAVAVLQWRSNRTPRVRLPDPRPSRFKTVISARRCDISAVGAPLD